MEPKLRCPDCGNSAKFHVRPYIEWHEAVSSGTGQWVADLECYDSEVGDGPVVTCAECGREGRWADFEDFRE